VYASVCVCVRERDRERGDVHNAVLAPAKPSRAVSERIDLRGIANYFKADKNTVTCRISCR